MADVIHHFIPRARYAQDLRMLVSMSTDSIKIGRYTLEGILGYAGSMLPSHFLYLRREEERGQNTS